jgi:hypothetical protein
MYQRTRIRRISQTRWLIAPILLSVLLLSGCAGVLGKTTSGYELAGITLKAAYDTAKPSCEQGIIPADKCVQLKTIYNEARLVYIMAGDALVLAIDIQDLTKRQAKLEEYNSLTTQLTKLTTSLIGLLNQLGLLKGGK